MNGLLKLEIAVLLILVLVAGYVRIGVIDAKDEILPTTPPDLLQTTPSTEPTIPTEPTTMPTLPPTEPAPMPDFTEGLTLQSPTYFVFDCESETVLANSVDLHKKIYPASITKLFTAYVALQYLEPDRVLKLGQEVNLVPSDSSLAYLKKNQTISVAYLVEAMMLRSGADAAYALAVATAREASGNSQMTISAALKYFVTMMNEEAQEQGMYGTHFVNADGYHDPDHYSTPADLITIGQLALENDLICKYAATVSERVKYSNGDIAVWRNTNDLVDEESSYYHPNAIGLKTGHTGAAGFCLMAAFELDGEYVLIGSFGSSQPESRYLDSLAIFERFQEWKAEEP